jgi:hypothetical protein
MGKKEEEATRKHTNVKKKSLFNIVPSRWE